MVTQDWFEGAGVKTLSVPKQHEVPNKLWVLSLQLYLFEWRRLVTHLQQAELSEEIYLIL